MPIHIKEFLETIYINIGTNEKIKKQNLLHYLDFNEDFRDSFLARYKETYEKEQSKMFVEQVDIISNQVKNLLDEN